MALEDINTTQTPGEYIRETILTPQKITVKDAAKTLGIGRPAFSNFINGNSSLSSDMAARIERAFGIPAQKLHDLQAAYDVAQTKGAPANTNAYVPPFLSIVANEIETWVDHNISARSRLSVFLRTLVHSTGVGLTKVDFSGNDDAQRPGCDGSVTATSGTPWIPEGQSGWEFGCNEAIKGKADHDYKKSTKAESKSDRSNTTFVFVTPRRWPGKTQWISERKAEGHWKDIRAYDASDLEQWLEQSVAGQTWFANETKRFSSKTRSLDQCWSDWAQVASPPLPRTLFKVAVEGARKTVASILAKEPEEPIIIAADSTEEAVAFLAELFSETGTELASFRDRIVVFDEPGILPKLAIGSSNFIAIATTREVERELAPFCRTIYTAVVYPRNAINTEPHVLLEPLNYDTFHSALEETGYSRDEVNRLENESGRSLTVLRRRLSKVPAVRAPDWSVNRQIATSLVPFMFAGAWSSTNKLDQFILSSLAKETSYEELEKQLQKLTQLNDSPVWSVGSYRGVVSKIDLLFAISGTLTRSELETYFEVADFVLSEDEPSLDLPEKDRLFAMLRGKMREISGALRKGICETLVLLAVYGNKLFQKKLGLNVESMAVGLVRKLLGEPLTTRTLEAQDRDLPTYAEAAPDEFLKILEKDLKTVEPASFGLMRPADSGIFGGTSRAGLLWALESLAWSPTTFSRVVFVLAKLAEIKIDDNWVNKPIESLKAIFLSWMPQTAASLQQRLTTIELLSIRFPKIAWEICMEQFGQLHYTGNYNHKPSWRNDAQGYGEPKQDIEIEAFVMKVVDMSLNWKTYDRSMIGDLVERLHGLDNRRQETLWSIVGNWAATANDFDKAQVREKIRVMIMSHKGDAQSEKSNSSRLIRAAKAAYTALEPTDLLNKYEWLFRDIWVQESFDEIQDDDLDYEKRDNRITKMRSEALQNIKAERGIEGILNLAEMGKSPDLIGALMVTSVLAPEEVVDFLLRVTKPGDEFNSWTFKNLVKGAIRSIEDDLARAEVLKQLRVSLPEENFVKLLEQAPFRTTTWSLIEEMDSSCQQMYWTEVIPSWGNQTDDELNNIVDQLLMVKRPRAAFHCVHLVFEKLRPAVLFRLMDRLVIGGDEPEGHYPLKEYHIEKAFKILNESATFTVEEMAGLEFFYIDILVHYRGLRAKHGAPNLEKYIGNHPEFFTQVIAWVYKRQDGKEDPEELRLEKADHIQNRAKQGYKLIEGLKFIPGRNKQGEIDPDLLLGWINVVRKSCAELGRQNAGDRSLGKLLATSPNGVDGVWPCEPVRQVLEQIQSEEISRSITIELFNSRGTHMRGENGDQERELASMYRRWALALEFSHPFVASTILKSMADEYEREAQHEDTVGIIRNRLR
ncbi:HigA family addiction module antitoxin [Spirosoma foliorum]|uniref:HigA family addiction module antidote protein n=1 Tax=Spirosoma foliorum TaxID=2710596 RepID=A0A7G5GS68_9BACT|nr:HigA family addiction module antitoxin [Spirosoma foliorum]QMW01710.1 HigA family addiction module antidote protein [Spirosoma foliorum]